MPDLIAEDWLVHRLGPDRANHRLRRELTAELRGQRREAGQDWSFWAFAEVAIPRILALTGLRRRGRANAARIEVVRNEVAVPGLPEPFRGYTLLQLTDLHADISRGAMHALPEILAGLRYDVCVITGDFRGRTYGPFTEALELVRMVLATIPTQVFGVLGNHDTAGMVPVLEAMGVRLLLNESELIQRGGARLWVAGVDDPHRYRTDDLTRAIAGIQSGEPIILLAHGTEIFQTAAAAGVSLMLSGHTHGGQMCLPGSVPVLTSSRMPRRLVSGPWREASMLGYTSKGVGTSVVDARFHCPPEVTLHILRPPDSV